MQAYACRIKPENFGAISSENPEFNLDEIKEWLKIHEDGYFIRDENSQVFDCQYMPMMVFEEIYRFENYQETDLFHKIK